MTKAELRGKISYPQTISNDRNNSGADTLIRSVIGKTGNREWKDANFTVMVPYDQIARAESKGGCIAKLQNKVITVGDVHYTFEDKGDARETWEALFPGVRIRTQNLELAFRIGDFVRLTKEGYQKFKNDRIEWNDGGVPLQNVFIVEDYSAENGKIVYICKVRTTDELTIRGKEFWPTEGFFEDELRFIGEDDYTFEND